MRVGESVLITEGPFAGLAGHVSGLCGNRVIVVMQLERRQLDIEMDLAWVVTATPQRKSVSRVSESARGMCRSDET